MASADATLRRTIRLFRAFLREQSDPDHFYQTLAADSVRQVSSFVALNGSTVLDVGGGAGYFCAAFTASGARYLAVNPDERELSTRDAPSTGLIRASGMELPFRAGAVDICYSSNVLEHVAAPTTMLDEMVNVTKPGGTVIASFTPWFSPWGGHETSPWHYLGGTHARRHFLRRNGHEPKNRYGENLFAMSVSSALRWARACETASLVRAVPRYHPCWANWIVNVPLLREVASWNLVLVLRKR